MKIQPKVRIEAVEFELSVAEAVSFVKDPSRVQEEVAMILKNGGVDPQTGGGL